MDGQVGGEGDAEEDAGRVARSDPILQAGTSRRIWAELYKVLSSPRSFYFFLGAN
jgi:hypothetical protein